MSVKPDGDSSDVGDLGRAGQERLEGTIPPPQVGDEFHVDPIVLDSMFHEQLRQSDEDN